VCKADEDNAFQEEEGVGTSVVNVETTIEAGMNYEQFANIGDTPTAEGQETFSRFEQMMIN